jgi:hypothetical protein
MKKRYLIISIFVALLMNGAFAKMLQFQNFLQVSPFADGTYWFLTRPLIYEVGDTGVIVEVPTGFVTDFTSIPRPFWSFLPQWGSYGPPAVVHDFLYWDQKCSREQADKIFLAAMKESDVGAFREYLIHKAVRWGGSFSWSSNRKLKGNGDIRVIPEDQIPIKTPHVTWEKYHEKLQSSMKGSNEQKEFEDKPDYCSTEIIL